MSQPEPETYTFDFHKETAEIRAESSDELSLKIGEFAGPLDLLLFLIRQEQANIFDIPIARITDEYLRFIRIMKSLDIAVAADFLVMASTLIEIKSKMLLPRDPNAESSEEEIDDPRQELVDRLIEYEKYKSAAQMLYEKTTLEQAIFARGKSLSTGCPNTKNTNRLRRCSTKKRRWSRLYLPVARSSLTMKTQRSRRPFLTF